MALFIFGWSYFSHAQFCNLSHLSKIANRFLGSSSSRQLALRGDGSSYDTFRRAYNTGRIEGDTRFVSYVDENGKRVPAQVIQIKENGEIVLRDDQGIVDISGEELNDIRVSATAKDGFQSEIPRERRERMGISPRAPPSRQLDSYQPSLRTDTYNSNYQPTANLTKAKRKFERVFEANTMPFSREVREKLSARELDPRDKDKIYFTEPNSIWVHHFNTHISDDTLLQGWKFHVSAKPENMHEIAEKLLPILQREGIHHKFLQPEYFDRYVNTIGQPNRSQQGKFITVYPQNREEAKKYAQILKQVMEENNFNRNDFINIPNEYEIAPGVFVRYGRMGHGNLRRSDGTEIPNTEDHIFTPDGQVMEDPRGQALPPFAREEMFELFQ